MPIRKHVKGVLLTAVQEQDGTLLQVFPWSLQPLDSLIGVQGKLSDCVLLCAFSPLLAPKCYLHFMTCVGDM